jgi:DNA polymerase-3 subunit epsilon/CBS domain-containing protein
MSFAPAAAGISGVPLSALSAIALDSETTGLDPAADRVIELGAVRIAAGAVSDDAFQSLVRPGLPVPPEAAAVHGIGDADLAGAPPFADAMRDLAAWAGPTVVLGYSLGFDLAVLRAEHARAGLPWRPPRGLDLLHLVEALDADLPDLGAEMVAAWLGIPVETRHRALADARLAARIFVALVPRLRARGIVTLAQAERAARSRTSRRGGEAAAGWTEGTAGRGAQAPYARIDSFPYRHRVRDIMSTPPLTVAPGTPLRQALSTMLARRVGALFLERDGDGGPGIVTERDVMRAIDADGGAALDRPVGLYGRRPLVSVADTEFVYRALTRMSAGDFRHLGVTGPDGALVGALSVRDLLRQRAADAVDLADSIEAAASPAELGRVWAALTAVARALALEEVDPRDIAAVISHELRALTRRACELAEAGLLAAGEGPAPCRYALMVLGSAGRGESLLAMDQDNAIVFAEGEPGGATDRWFAALGSRVAEILDGAGVAFCKGGVMASRPEWRRDLAHWRRAVGAWVGRSSPEDILNADIFFDAAAVHGDGALAETLMAEARGLARGARTFRALLAMNAGQFTRPVGWFGRLRTSSGRVDLNSGGIMPIFSAARVAALAHGIAERSTPARLAAARDIGAVPATTVAALTEAHRILLGLILAQQLHDIERGIPLSNRVAPAELGPHDRGELGWALEQVPRVADILGTPPD